MDKPNIGQKLQVVKPELVEMGMTTVTVEAVYDSLDEDWGSNGEMAWPLYDEDPDRKAEWYVVCNIDDGLETSSTDAGEKWSFCSFEVGPTT